MISGIVIVIGIVTVIFLLYYLYDQFRTHGRQKKPVVIVSTQINIEQPKIEPKEEISLIMENVQSIYEPEDLFTKDTIISNVVNTGEKLF